MFSYGVVVKLPEEIEDDIKEALEKVGQAKKAEPASDVCGTPSPGEPVDIPYPNTGMASDTSSGSKKVKVEGDAAMIKGQPSRKALETNQGRQTQLWTKQLTP